MVSQMMRPDPLKFNSNAIKKKKMFSVENVKNESSGVPVVAQWSMNPTRNMRLHVRSLALLSGLRIRHCCELWCGLQTRLRSHVAVALAWLTATALIRPLAWEPSYAAGAAQEMAKRQK